MRKTEELKMIIKIKAAIVDDLINQLGQHERRLAILQQIPLGDKNANQT